MNKIPTYLIYCKKCKKETPHLVHSLNRLKGVRIMCAICSSISKHYLNFRKLQEKEIKQNK